MNNVARVKHFQCYEDRYRQGANESQGIHQRIPLTAGLLQASKPNDGVT